MAVIATKKQKKANKPKTTAKTRKAVMAEKFGRIARMLGVPVSELKTLAKRTENHFRSVGKAVRKNGHVVVYAKRPLAMDFVHKKHVITERAMVKDAIDCPLAKCAKDADACLMGKYSTSVHVGNIIVTFWSELCPDLSVKYMLPPSLRATVRNWDEQVKKKVKNRRFKLADGTYYLSPCSPSFMTPGPRGNGEKRGKNFRKPTRRLTVRSDISLAASTLSAKAVMLKKS